MPIRNCRRCGIIWAWCIGNKATIPDAGIAIEEEAIALKPDFAEAPCWRAAKILMQVGYPADALVSLDQLVALTPENPSGWVLRSGAQLLLGRNEEALDGLDRALEVHPDHVDALANRGTVLRMLNRAQESLENLDKALALRPGDPKILDMRAATLEGAYLGRPAGSAGRCRCGAEARARFPNAHYNRAGALADLHRYDEAAAAYDRVLALMPEHKEARNAGAT